MQWLKNTKIHNILDIIKLLKSIKPNKCTPLKKLWNN